MKDFDAAGVAVNALSYDEADAALAWQRTMAFYAANLV